MAEPGSDSEHLDKQFREFVLNCLPRDLNDHDKQQWMKYERKLREGLKNLLKGHHVPWHDCDYVVEGTVNELPEESHSDPWEFGSSND